MPKQALELINAKRTRQPLGFRDRQDVRHHNRRTIIQMRQHAVPARRSQRHVDIVERQGVNQPAPMRP